MSAFWRMVVGGALVVLAFDTVASVASLVLGFPYFYAIVGSILIYFAVGYFGFRRLGFGRAIGAALMIQLVDATLGWFISWKIGPGALSEEQRTFGFLIATIVFVLIFAAICAVVGGAVARAVGGPRAEVAE